MLESGHPYTMPVCNRSINSSYITGFLSGLNELLYVKCLEECFLLLSAYKLSCSLVPLLEMPFLPLYLTFALGIKHCYPTSPAI